MIIITILSKCLLTFILILKSISYVGERGN